VLSVAGALIGEGGGPLEDPTGRARIAIGWAGDGRLRCCLWAREPERDTRAGRVTAAHDLAAPFEMHSL
jgi:hypothetical protein